LGKKGITIAHNGVDEKLYTHKFTKTKHPQVLYLGRIKPYKSIDIVIKAMKSLVEKNKDIKLVIAGSGENEGELKKLAKQLEIEKNVDFRGRVTEAEKAKLLAESWVFVQPSQMEGWGISVIEANACGTPVVASNVPGLRDSVQNPHTGYLVQQGNIDLFAARIDLILSNKNIRTDLSTNSVEWAKNFTWKKSADNFLDVIRKVIND
jgi:glycosyltransferase involved in cell wall biosynthesis